MQEFSLEKLSEEVHFGKTKKYFYEVLSSYSNGNYRSAVVMLWSVAVCDIVYKLQHLIDLYDDASAKNILEELTAQQEKDPRSSAWELKLIDDVYEKTQLLDTSEYENIRYLQKQRHLSSHPVLNSERELHSPKRETVRALIRNTLEEILIKPPFYTQRITNELLEDISESSVFLNTSDKIRKYVESRYFSRTKPQVELNIFKTLWKLVFKLENEECNKNRNVNFRVLELLAFRNSNLLEETLEEDKDYYGNICATGMPVGYLVYFISHYDHLYKTLNQDAKLKIEHCVENHPIGKTMGWFLKANLKEHASDIEKWIDSDDSPNFSQEQLDSLLQISDTLEWQSKFCEILIYYYTKSCNFDQADNRFQVAIPKYIKLFNKELLELLVRKIEGNSQCWARGRASQDYKIIIDIINKLNEDFDFTEFPNFAGNIIDYSDEDKHTKQE